MASLDGQRSFSWGPRLGLQRDLRARGGGGRSSSCRSRWCCSRPSSFSACTSCPGSPELDLSPLRASTSINMFDHSLTRRAPRDFGGARRATHSVVQVPETQSPGTLVLLRRSLEHWSQGHRPQDHRSRNKRIGLLDVLIRFVFGFVLPDLLIVDLGD